MNEPDQTEVAPSRLRTVFVLVLAVVVGAHLIFVTAAAMPTNQYSDAMRPATSYLSPYFAQNWRLFAPKPISGDRSVLFQAAFRYDTGELRTTEWVDWTHVELDLVRHQLVGGRAGYVTNQLHGQMSRRQDLNDRLREVVQVDQPDQVVSWESLERDLLDAAQNSEERTGAHRWLRYENVAIALGTAVMQSREPAVEIVALRYALRSQGVPPYSVRHLDVDLREDARPEATQTISGWREPAADLAVSEAVRVFDERHR